MTDASVIFEIDYREESPKFSGRHYLKEVSCGPNSRFCVLSMILSPPVASCSLPQQLQGPQETLGGLDTLQHTQKEDRNGPQTQICDH